VDRLRYLELVEPNLIAIGATPALNGDFVQTVQFEGAYNASTIIEYVYGYKTNNTKNGLVVHCTAAAARIAIDHVHMAGGGACSILMGHLAGSAVISNLYARDPTPTALPFIRFDPGEASAITYAMATNSSLTIRNVFIEGSIQGFYKASYTPGAFSFDGLITIDGCTVGGATAGTFSLIELFTSGSQSTFAANFDIVVKNNASTIAGKVQVAMPTSTANDARFVFANNSFSSGAYTIGATSYADLAAFAAAHSHATANIAPTDPLLTADYKPTATSPLLAAGTHLGYRRDIDGKQRRNPPCIGAYDAAPMRTPLA